MPTLRDPAPVRVYGVVVGHLLRDAHGAIRFTPTKEWLEGEQHPPLGLAMLRNPAVRMSSTGLPPWFENLLPEADGALRRLLCKRLKIRHNDSAALLVALGNDLPGAVEVGGDGISEPSDVGAEDDEGTGEPLPPGLRISLAGLQLKLSMRLQDERLVLPAHGGVGEWIVKIPGEKLPDLPHVEASTMSWARAVGLTVPEFRVVESSKLEGNGLTLLDSIPYVFAIKRFDRMTDGRIHQEDFAQVYEVPPGDKYGSGQQYKPAGKIRYSGMARLIDDVCGRNSRDDFIERVAFIIGSGNDDAHLKNWSFQWTHDHRPRLSPCYDLVSTISWPEVSGTALALELAKGVSHFPLLDRRSIQRFLDACSASDAEVRFFDVLQRMRTRWTDLEEVPERMRAALSDHWSRVPILQSLGGLPTR